MKNNIQYQDKDKENIDYQNNNNFNAEEDINQLEESKTEQRDLKKHLG